MKTITLEDIDRYVAEHTQDESAYLKSGAEYVDQVISYFHDRKEAEINRLPWDKCHGRFGIRPNEVTLWLGINGHGKSLILGQITNHLMQIGEKVCIASLEMRPHVTMARMCRQAFVVKAPSVDLIQSYHQWTDGKLFIYDQNGSIPAARILNLGRYCASIGIKHLVIDSLMKVVSREDDYNSQKEFVDQLCILARDTGIHVHLVHHSRKGSDETKRPGKFDARGTAAVTDLVDNCVSVFRIKEKTSEYGDADAVLTVDKQRHGEWEGGILLKFDTETQTFYEDAMKRARRLVIPNASVTEEVF